MKNWLIATILAVIMGSIFGLLSKRWDIFVLMFTAIYIGWYSWETFNLVRETRFANYLSQKMWKEMVMTNKLSIQPAVVMEYDNNWNLVLKNIGKGAAININIKAINSKTSYIFKLYKNILGSGESVLIQMQKVESDGKHIVDVHQEFQSNPVSAIIYFDRIKKLPEPLTTKIEFKNPPTINIQETNWHLG